MIKKERVGSVASGQKCQIAFYQIHTSVQLNMKMSVLKGIIAATAWKSNIHLLSSLEPSTNLGLSSVII